MYQKIKELSRQYYNETVNIRRDIHTYPERGWLELRTASLIALKLEEIGYKVLIGKDIMKPESRMGIPNQKILDFNYNRAIKENVNIKYLELMKDGFTAVAGVLNNGEGPTIAIRFDMDALGLLEDQDHIIRSNHFGVMHACGHDGHVAIGLTTAKILMDIKEHLHGTLKLIFQPAEEGVRGAKSIAESGFLDDVDYIYAAHIMPKEKDYDLYFGMDKTFATTKLDVIYHGVSTHAAMTPELGRNALMSAANCIINLYSIPHHSEGQTRINVGSIHAGSERNIIPETAKLEVEIRGSSTKLNEYMEVHAMDIINASALMHDTVVEINKVGESYALECDFDFMQLIKNTCLKHMADIHIPAHYLSPLNGSDDFSYMMKRVQDNGGKATYLKLLTDVKASAHSSSFDFNEEVLDKGPRIMASIAYTLMK